MNAELMPGDIFEFSRYCSEIDQFRLKMKFLYLYLQHSLINRSHFNDRVLTRPRSLEIL